MHELLDTLAAVKRWPIRYQLLRLVLVVAAPLALLVAMNLQASIRHAEELAYVTVRNAAQDLKLSTEQFLDDAKRRLQLLAARPLITAMDPHRCDPLLGEARKLLPEYTNIVLRDLHGELVCWDVSLPTPGLVADSEWFREGKERADFAVGDPVIGKSTGKWISILTYPVRDEQHEIVGLLVLPVDLEFFRHLAEKFVELPPRSIAALIDRHGTYLMNSSDPGKTGQNSRGDAIIDTLLRGDRGALKVVGADAVERTYFHARLPDSGWHVYAGIPSDALMAPARARAIEGGILAAVILLVFDPRNLFDIGFQLSFAAVTGILSLYKPCQSLFKVLPGFIANTMAVSLAAWIGTTPISFYHFHTITPIAVLANVPIVPMADSVMLLGLGLAFSGACCPALAYAFAGCLKAVLSGMVICAAWFSQVPFGHLNF